jgi:hypothetical protein
MVDQLYCVWYIDSTTEKERCVGVCRTWSEARVMANQLYTIKKKIDQSENLSTGFFLYIPGELYTLKKPKRWQIMPLLTSNT